jgi:hypothetical protein
MSDFGQKNSRFYLAGYTAALDMKPHIVVLMLGTNDCKPNNWNEPDFVNSCLALLQDVTALPHIQAIFICRPPPIFLDGFETENTAMLAAVDTLGASVYGVKPDERPSGVAGASFVVLLGIYL